MKKFLANVALCAVSIVVTLAALEVASRLYFYGDLGLPSNTAPFREHSESRGFKLKPSSSLRMQAPDFNVEVRINSHGLRGPESDLTGDRQRLLLVGDSGVFGSGVSDDAVFPVLLEDALGADKVDVLNGGASTYNTVQELFFLREEGLAMAPSAVVLFIYPSNDLQGNTRALESLYKKKPSRPHASIDGTGALAYDLSSLSIKYGPDAFSAKGRSFWKSLLKSSPLYNMVKETVRGFKQDKFRDPNIFIGWPFLAEFAPEYSTTGRDGEAYDAVWQDSWAVTQKLILQMRDEVQGAGARFAVSVLPHKMQIEASYRERILVAFPDLAFDLFRINREVQAFAEANGIAYIDTARPLRDAAEQGEGGLFFDITDEHMTAKSHALVVPALAAGIRDTGLLSPD